MFRYKDKYKYKIYFRNLLLLLLSSLRKFHQPIVGTQDQRREIENDDASVSQDASKTSWQEASNKVILCRRLGIGPKLDCETQNCLSRTIRSMISHTCGLSLKETYTLY